MKTKCKQNLLLLKVFKANEFFYAHKRKLNDLYCSLILYLSLFLSHMSIPFVEQISKSLKINLICFCMWIYPVQYIYVDRECCWRFLDISAWPACNSRVFQNEHRQCLCIYTTIYLYIYLYTLIAIWTFSAHFFFGVRICVGVCLYTRKIVMSVSVSFDK